MEKVDVNLGCKDIQYEDSILSEECWSENHRGDSRKWLISDGYKKKSAHQIYSTMKSSYRLPIEDDFHYIGKRKSLFMRECYKKSYEEVVEDRKKAPHVMEYCTEYDGNYFIPDFESVCQDKIYNKDSDLHQKYPLYGSTTMSFWQHKMEHTEEVPPGRVSKITDLKNVFRRNSAFSVPIMDSLQSSEK